MNQANRSERIVSLSWFAPPDFYFRDSLLLFFFHPPTEPELEDPGGFLCNWKNMKRCNEILSSIWGGDRGHHRSSGFMSECGTWKTLKQGKIRNGLCAHHYSLPPLYEAGCYVFVPRIWAILKTWLQPIALYFPSRQKQRCLGTDLLEWRDAATSLFRFICCYPFDRRGAGSQGDCRWCEKDSIGTAKNTGVISLVLVLSLFKSMGISLIHSPIPTPPSDILCNLSFWARTTPLL